MQQLAYSLLMIAAGWLLRGALGATWRRVYRPHRFGDGQHLWTEVAGRTCAFTDDQLNVAESRARNLADPRRLWPWRLAWIVGIGLLLCALTGCTSRNGTKVWWNPTTWGTDRATVVQDVASDQKQNRRALDLQALREVFKSRLALRSAPQENRAVQVATRTTDNAYSLMAISQGELDLGFQQQDRETIVNLLSENAELRAEGEKIQAKAEGSQAKLSAENKQLQDENAAAVLKLEEGYVRERKLANTVRNFWFVVGGLALLWIGGNLLSAASRFVPALAPVAHLVNGVAAPMATFALHRAETGLKKVGVAMAAVRAGLPEMVARLKEEPDAAVQVGDEITTIFDTETDRDHQAIIGHAAATAPRT